MLCLIRITAVIHDRCVIERWALREAGHINEDVFETAEYHCPADLWLNVRCMVGELEAEMSQLVGYWAVTQTLASMATGPVNR